MSPCRASAGLAEFDGGAGAGTTPPRHPLQHPPFPPPGGHPVRDRHADTLSLLAVFSKLDGQRRFVAQLLPTLRFGVSI